MPLFRSSSKKTTDEHPPENDLRAYADKTLFGKPNEMVYMHLKYCSFCLRRLAQLSKVPSPDAIVSGGSNAGWWQALARRFGKRRR